MSQPKLYTFNESGNSYKVRLLAAFLNIDLEHVEIDFYKGQHKSPEFLKVNPKGQVPAFAHGDRILTDSAGILVYLAGTYPDPGSSKTPSSFWSNDAVEQAEIVDWLAFSANFIPSGLSRARAIMSIYGTAKKGDPELVTAQTQAKKTLELLDQKFEKDDWLALGRPTIAEASLFPYVALCPMGDVSLDPYLAVKRWLERVKKLPGFSDAPMLGLDDPLYKLRGK